jgi:ATP-dependent exoDNAse (exonuclease V) beta subunit
MTARGRIIHRLLEEVEWIETFDRSDEDLRAIGRTVEANEEAVASALAEFRSALAWPVMKAILSKPQANAEVWRERPFMVLLPRPNGGECMWSGAFDRVVIRKELGQLVSAEVIDFKTDRFARTSVESHSQQHDPQLRVYHEAVTTMLDIRPDCASAWCHFIHRDTLHALRE